MSEANAIQAPPAAAPTSSFAMIRTLGGMALISGVLIALAYEATFDIIKRNKEEALRKAVFTAIPGAADQVRFELRDDGAVEKMDGDPTGRPQLFVGFDEAGQFLGVALEASGQGYGDVIRVLYGYSPEDEVITGLKVLESKETPGLGDRIAKEPFLENFREMDVRLDAGKTSPLHPIAFAKHGAKTDAWQVDGISGATISSKAIAAMLLDSTQEMLPIVNRNLTALKDVQ